MGKGRVYVYPFDFMVLKNQRTLVVVPWTGGSKKSKHRVKGPTRNGQFFVGSFLENRRFFGKIFKIPKLRVLSILQKKLKNRRISTNQSASQH
jgi:hypothetical protein